MLKLLRRKIQSLNEAQQNFLTAILILINLGIVIFWMNFWLSLRKPTLPLPIVKEKPSSEIKELPEEVIQKLTVPEGVKVEPLPEEVIKNLTVPQ